MLGDLPAGFTLAFDPRRGRWYLRDRGAIVADAPRGYRRTLVEHSWHVWDVRAARHAHLAAVE